MFDWTGIQRVWRPGQSLGLFVIFVEPFLTSGLYYTAERRGNAVLPGVTLLLECKYQWGGGVKCQSNINTDARMLAVSSYLKVLQTSISLGGKTPSLNKLIIIYHIYPFLLGYQFEIK